MTPAEYIRTHILKVTQQEMAGRLNVTQPTIFRHMRSGYFPPEAQIEIRKWAMELGIEWNDTWFFEVPDSVKSEESGELERAS